MSVITGAHRSGFRAAAGSVPLAALFSAGAIVLGALASLAHIDALGFPLCAFKAATSLPCVTCGSTRALVRLAHFDLFGAMAMNPLVASALIALVPWGIADAVLALRGRALVLEVGPALGRALRWGAIPLVIANWAYLIAVGR